MFENSSTTRESKRWSVIDNYLFYFILFYGYINKVHVSHKKQNPYKYKSNVYDDGI